MIKRVFRVNFSRKVTFSNTTCTVTEGSVNPPVTWNYPTRIEAYARYVKGVSASCEFEGLTSLLLLPKFHYMSFGTRHPPTSLLPNLRREGQDGGWEGSAATVSSLWS